MAHSIEVGAREQSRLKQVVVRLIDPDERRRWDDLMGTHQFTVLTIALAAVLSGARSFLAIGEYAAALTQSQLKRLGARFNRNKHRYDPPSESTLRRVLQSSDAAVLDDALGHWLFAQSDEAETDALAIDGKTLRGARRPDGSQVHLLSAFLHQQGIIVAQREVGVKTNEIPELPRLLLRPLNT